MLYLCFWFLDFWKDWTRIGRAISSETKSAAMDRTLGYQPRPRPWSRKSVEGLETSASFCVLICRRGSSVSWCLHFAGCSNAELGLSGAACVEHCVTHARWGGLGSVTNNWGCFCQPISLVSLASLRVGQSHFKRNWTTFPILGTDHLWPQRSKE